MNVHEKFFKIQIEEIQNMKILADSKNKSFEAGNQAFNGTAKQRILSQLSMSHQNNTGRYPWIRKKSQDSDLLFN